MKEIASANALRFIFIKRLQLVTANSIIPKALCSSLWNNTLTILVINSSIHTSGIKRLWAKGNVQNKGMYPPCLPPKWNKQHHEWPLRKLLWAAAWKLWLWRPGWRLWPLPCLWLGHGSGFGYHYWGCTEDAPSVHLDIRTHQFWNSSCSVPFPWVMITSVSWKFRWSSRNLPSNLYIL